MHNALAKTLNALANISTLPEEIGRPGYIFAIVAHHEGVLKHPGQHGIQINYHDWIGEGLDNPNGESKDSEGSEFMQQVIWPWQMVWANTGYR